MRVIITQYYDDPLDKPDKFVYDDVSMIVSTEYEITLILPKGHKQHRLDRDKCKIEVKV